MKTYYLKDFYSEKTHYDGNLCLNGTSIQSLPEGLTVGGSLCLNGTSIQSLPEGLTVGGSLYLNGTSIRSLPEGLTVGGSLDLEDTSIQSLPDGLTVGGDLFLRGTSIQSLPEGLTVGGSLDLKGTSIRSLPDELTVGRFLFLNGTPIQNQSAELTKVKHFKNGDYVPGRYLYVDGILTHVAKKRRVGAYDLYIGKIKGKNVVSDGTYFAHCNNFRDGIADILFKTAKDRGADQYKALTLDSRVKTEDAITMYRVITGACRAGTQAFIDSLGKLKESYTVKEIIELTAGQYGAERLHEFFE